jgi:integrase
MQWKNIDWVEEVITFTNKKGNRKTKVPLFPEIRAELERWRAWAIAAGYGEPQPDWYLVANREDSRYIHGVNSRANLRAEPWTWRLVMTQRSATGTVWRDVRKLLDQLGIGRGEGTHTFRRSAAKIVAKRHGLPAAQALLDHKSIVTTQLYTGNEDGLELLAEALMAGGTFSPAISPTPPANVVPLFKNQGWAASA